MNASFGSIGMIICGSLFFGIAALAPAHVSKWFERLSCTMGAVLFIFGIIKLFTP